jgi:lipopolysaccharide transport system permease protein
MISNFKKLFAYRELLFSLTKKELKVKYRGSVLGFFWSLLNPVLIMLVYSFVFTIVLRQGIKEFAVFLLCALLPFNFFQNSVNYGAGCVIANANLVKKIYFPKEIIPLSIVLSNLVNFLLELVVLFVVLSIFKYKFYTYLYLLPLIILIEVFFVSGITLLVSSLNVLFRDLQHLVSILMMVWFFGTPIIYPLAMVPERFQFWMQLNPMAVFATFYRDIFYYVKFPDFVKYQDSFGLYIPDYRIILICLGVTFGIFFLGYFVFKKIEPRFAEEV